MEPMEELKRRIAERREASLLEAAMREQPRQREVIVEDLPVPEGDTSVHSEARLRFYARKCEVAYSNVAAYSQLHQKAVRELEACIDEYLFEKIKPRF
jgi:hypothetical protein